MNQYDLKLFTEYEEKKDEKTKEIIEQKIAEIKAAQPDAAGICAMYPFYMAYETQIAKKEHYQDIINAFTEIAPQYLKSELSDKVVFLNAIIETMAVMAQPMFEHYMALADMFKTALKTIDLNQTSNADLSAILRKACAMKVILTEKYQDLI